MYSVSAATDSRSTACRKKYCSVHIPAMHLRPQMLLSFHKNFLRGSYHSKNIAINICIGLGSPFCYLRCKPKKSMAESYQNHEDIFRQRQHITLHNPKSSQYIPRQWSPGDLGPKTPASINRRMCIGLTIESFFRNMKWLYLAKWKIRQRNQAHITVPNETFPGYTWIYDKFYMIWNRVWHSCLKNMSTLCISLKSIQFEGIKRVNTRPQYKSFVL